MTSREQDAFFFGTEVLDTNATARFETYFPHIDNVYSHRSTQKYKRKPFISHYWDCRMKGRPPGTPKSDDPSKKKRKRNARERDLCDVKIKITEYFPGATILQDGDSSLNLAQSSAYSSPQHQFFGDGLPRSVDAHLNGEKFWTIQRVNGNGGNGKGDGVAGPHKHSLDKSDEIKKSTVQRYIAAQEKEAKKVQVGHSLYYTVDVAVVTFCSCTVLHSGETYHNTGGDENPHEPGPSPSPSLSLFLVAVYSTTHL